MDGTHSLAALRDFEIIRFCLDEDEVARVNEAVRGKSNASTKKLKASTIMKARPQLS